MKASYNPRDIYNSNPDLRRALDTMVNGTVETDMDLHALYRSLLDEVNGEKPDKYFILADYASYIEAKLQANRDYETQRVPAPAEQIKKTKIWRQVACIVTAVAIAAISFSIGLCALRYSSRG